MRISDWSSDVCSSDLRPAVRRESLHDLAQPLRRDVLERPDHRAHKAVLDVSGEHAEGAEDAGQRRHKHRADAEQPGDLHGMQGPAAAERHQSHLRSEEHTSELQSLMRTSYAVFCLTKKNSHNTPNEKSSCFTSI